MINMTVFLYYIIQERSMFAGPFSSKMDAELEINKHTPEIQSTLVIVKSLINAEVVR